jgi:small subunit ribosomal protein S1
LSHSRTFEDVKDDYKPARKHNNGGRKNDSAAQINNVAAGTSLGDLGVLADLKAKMEKGE